MVARVDALQAFLKTADGENLLAGYRRAVNILRIEEKKDGRSRDGEPDPALLAAPEEVALFRDMAAAQELIAAEIAHERFAEAMTAMARLGAPSMLLREGNGQRPGTGAARKSLAAFVAPACKPARGRRFLEDRGLVHDAMGLQLRRRHRPRAAPT